MFTLLEGSRDVCAHPGGISVVTVKGEVRVDSEVAGEEIEVGECDAGDGFSGKSKKGKGNAYDVMFPQILMEPLMRMKLVRLSASGESLSRVKSPARLAREGNERLEAGISRSVRKELVGSGGDLSIPPERYMPSAWLRMGKLMFSGRLPVSICRPSP